MEYYYLNDADKRVFDRLIVVRRPMAWGRRIISYMPQGKPTEWMIRPRDRLRGELTQAVMTGGQLLAGGKRTAHFYQPPVDEPAPLVVVWDGGDYLAGPNW